MFVAFFALAGIVLLILAGLNVVGPRFAPQWLGFACLALAAFQPAFNAVIR